MKIFSIAVLILCGAIVLSAQTKKIRWTTELCQFEGTYDAKKYTEAQLKDTLKLFAIGGFSINANATAREFADIKNLNIAALEKEYALKSNQVKNLKLVNSPYWETQRQMKLKELEQVYQLSKITMQAYSNPAVIKQHANAEVCVKRYANPLINGGDELLKTWRAVNEDSRKRNSDPGNLRRIFDSQFNSPDKLKYARIEVMSFGWWNCANEFIKYVEHDGKQEANFKKLFARVRTISCDEP